MRHEQVVAAFRIGPVVEARQVHSHGSAIDRQTLPEAVGELPRVLGRQHDHLCDAQRVRRERHRVQQWAHGILRFFRHRQHEGRRAPVGIDQELSQVRGVVLGLDDPRLLLNLGGTLFHGAFLDDVLKESRHPRLDPNLGFGGFRQRAQAELGIHPGPLADRDLGSPLSLDVTLFGLNEAQRPRFRVALVRADCRKRPPVGFMPEGVAGPSLVRQLGLGRALQPFQGDLTGGFGLVHMSRDAQNLACARRYSCPALIVGGFIVVKHSSLLIPVLLFSPAPKAGVSGIPFSPSRPSAPGCARSDAHSPPALITCFGDLRRL